MATETQYKVFKEIYDDEAKRYSDLGTRCNLYLTIITFYVGVILLKVSDVVKAVTGFGVSAVWFFVRRNSSTIRALTYRRSRQYPRVRGHLRSGRNH
jgi:hypothetical protein